MEPRYLRQLAEIIDLGSLSLAAKSLNVTQPTLSRNIKSLEALIGAPVLQRGRYGVTPTAIGAALAREGRSIRDALRQADLDLGHWKGGLAGRLKIGVGTMLLVMEVDYRTYREPVVIWSLLGVVTLALVLVLFSPPVNNARRWFSVFSLGVQPSEVAKLSAILFIAALLERRRHRINELGYALVPIALVVGLLVERSGELAGESVAGNGPRRRLSVAARSGVRQIVARILGDDPSDRGEDLFHAGVWVLIGPAHCPVLPCAAATRTSRLPADGRAPIVTVPNSPLCSHLNQMKARPRWCSVDASAACAPAHVSCPSVVRDPRAITNKSAAPWRSVRARSCRRRGPTSR